MKDLDISSIDAVEKALMDVGYVPERSLSTAIFLALRLKKPLFLEGEPGVGKTDVAVRLSQVFNSRLIRLQCYEGIDASSALYDWDYPKQLLFIRMHEAIHMEKEAMAKGLYHERFLIRRPLLEAIWNEDPRPPILLIDELDRSDEEFEAFLLEILSDFQVTIPELGTIKAKKRPFVVITSNRTRDVHDALKRRCLYHWIDYPSLQKEYHILMVHVPQLEENLARNLVALIQGIRRLDLLKKPGISETIDWARSLLELGKEEITWEVVQETIGCVLKYKEDQRLLKESGEAFLKEILKGDR